MQKTHETTSFQERKFPLVLVMDDVSGPANIGSLFRLADAFNIEKLIFCGTEIDLESNRLKRTARSTVKNVLFEEQEDCLQTCSSLKKEGYRVFALEITEESSAIESENFRNHKKVALVLGNENSGIKKEVLEIANKSLHINMFGKNSSMNVSHAAAIALFEITKSLQSVQ